MRAELRAPAKASESPIRSMMSGINAGRNPP